MRVRNNMSDINVKYLSLQTSWAFPSPSPSLRLGSAVLPVHPFGCFQGSSAFGLGLPATRALRAMVRQHRALARPPVLPNARQRKSIRLRFIFTPAGILKGKSNTLGLNFSTTLCGCPHTVV